MYKIFLIAGRGKRNIFSVFPHAQTEIGTCKDTHGHTHTHTVRATANRFATLSTMLTMLEWTGSWLLGSQKRVPQMNVFLPLAGQCRIGK